jgi:hypothetical protein
MVGEVEPLKALQEPSSRAAVIDHILSEYPTTLLPVEESFYRIRKAPKNTEDCGEYDSPPLAVAGTGRLDSSGFLLLITGLADLCTRVSLHSRRRTVRCHPFPDA